MKYFSKCLLLAAATMAFCGSCDDNDEVLVPSVVEETLSVSPHTAHVSSKGGEVYAMVTSSGEWQLQGEENAYVTPQTVSGKDGETVTFTVNPNDTQEDKTFSYTFTCGKLSDTFTITLNHKASDTSEELSLTYVEGSELIEQQGGHVSVLVISSKEWTLEGTSEFAHPSATSGADGDEVRFEVDENTTTQERTAEFVFKMGSQEQHFTLTQKPYIEHLEILSEKEIVTDFSAKEKVQVILDTDAAAEELTAAITSDVEGWVTLDAFRPSETGATAFFNIAENKSLDSRSADIVIKGKNGGEAALKITQLAKSVIEIEKPFYYADAEACDINIPVVANVEFDVTFDQSQNWVKYNGYTEGKLHFHIEALTEAARSIDITLTEKNVPEGITPVTASVKIKQNRDALISTVADMRNSRIYFHYIYSARPLRDLTKLTFEALVNVQEARKSGEVSTIMGIHDKVLLRLGDDKDSSVAWNQLELQGENGVATDASLVLADLDRWYHVAVTCGGNKAKFYIDGKLVYTGEFELPNRGASLGITFQGSESYNNRSFWLGYSYDDTRFFPGYMSEVRIWNRELPQDELMSENHFYGVDAKADGLVGYWKLNEGSGSVINDVAKRNKMEAQTMNGSGSYELGIKWVKTRLP